MSNLQAGSNEEIEEIIKRVKAGDSECFRVLVERFQGEIFRLIVRQIGEYSVAEDLVQETFIKAFKSIGKFRSDSSFKTWVTRIALNTTNNYFSSRAFRRQSLQVAFEPEQHDLSFESYNMETEQKLKLARSALAKLKQKYRSVVALCVLEQKSYQEAAEILGIPAGTVGSRLNTAIAMLHDKMRRATNE